MTSATDLGPEQSEHERERTTKRDGFISKMMLKPDHGAGWPSRRKEERRCLLSWALPVREG